MAKVKRPQLTPREAQEMGLKSLGWECATLLQAMIDKLGPEETQRVIYPYFKELGKRTGRRLPKLGFAGKDAITIGEWIDFLEDQVLLVEGKLTEKSPDRVVKVITKCPLQKLPGAFCAAFQGQIDGILEEVNPQLRWYQTRVIPNGFETCEWVVEKK